MSPISIGLMSLPESWETAKLHAAWAENAGFASIWTGDHLRHPRDPTHGFLDGWTLLPAWATVTQRVVLGMLVSNLIYRNPALLARQAAAVDVISGGRLVLGLGTGVYESDHAMAGVPIWSPRERVDRLREVLPLVDALLRGETVTSTGPYYPMREASVRPIPVQQPRPDIVVGALGPRTIDVAVRHADVWNTWAGFHEDEEQAVGAIRRQCQQVDLACEEAGRDPATLRRSVCLYPPFDPWVSEHGLERLVSTLLPLGITEYIAYAPSSDKEQLMVRALDSLRD